MPTGYQLTKAGYGGLAHAIQRYYSYQEVAARLGLTVDTKRKPRGYWDEFANLEREIREFASSLGTPNLMPTVTQLDEAGRHDLKNAIVKPQHGGYGPVAEWLGLRLTSQAKPSRYWTDFENLRRELLHFINTHSDPGLMPTRSELERAGRSDLAAAIGQHGGTKIVAGHLDLDIRRQARHGRKGWEDFATIEREVLALAEQLGPPPPCRPTRNS
ncbi:MAG: hypothetical protein M3Q03_04005 [Chloroflexota bacterium]|nr:hypothetical protein [Chloroflexota bacterium]